MANSVTKADLVTRIATETGLKKVEAEKALVAATAAILGALQDGKKVTLVGFGTFSIANRKARMGRDPQTKKPIKIKATKAIRFKAGKAMKDAVNT
jgi:DNA-binding protein HU-beta